MKRSLRVATIGSPLIGLALALAGIGCGQRGGAATSTADTRSALAAEQAHILERFGGLTRIQDILAAGYIPTHGAASIENVGVAFTRIVDVPVLMPGAPALPPKEGEPNLLMFAPASGATDTVTVCPVPAIPDRPCPVDLVAATRPGSPAVTDALWADEPYVLAGWGYTARIDSGAGAAFPLDQPPTLAFVTPQQWFVHEAGWHNLDGTFAIDRGLIDPPGAPSHAKDGPPQLHAGAPHGRFWDVHLWVDRAAGVPVVSMSSPTPIAGITVPPGSFAYPAELRE
jgi:hypothetical protein